MNDLRNNMTNGMTSDITGSSTRHPLSRALFNTPKGAMRSPARVLAWFSIGLGVAELLLPRAMARATGAANLPALTRAHGLREVGIGIGLLATPNPEPWLWGRVAGDVLDIATVGAGAVSGGRPLRTLASLAVLCGIAYVDIKCAEGAAPKTLRVPVRDYSQRSGFPKPVAEMRGAARAVRTLTD